MPLLRHARCLVLLVAPAVVAGGCSSGHKVAAPTRPTAAETTAPPTTAGPPSTPVPTAPPTTLPFVSPIVGALSARRLVDIADYTSPADTLHPPDYNPAVTDPNDGFVDEDHPWTFINIDGSINAFARNITSQYFGYSCVYVTGNSKWVTVQDSTCLDPISMITGGRRYSFNTDNSQMVLFQRCLSVEGRHDYVEGSNVPGPNVFLDSKATMSHADTGPHHRWSAGGLFDNITTDNQINVRNRGNSGTGHGWSGANMVIWNSTAS